MVGMLAAPPASRAQSSQEPPEQAQPPVMEQAQPPATIPVQGFTISGNRVVPTWDLAQVLTPFVDQTLTLVDLERVADLITDEYRRRGYSLAKAYLPEQKIKFGIVEIAVLEGYAGNLDITGNKFYSTAFIRRYFGKVYDEEAIKYSSLERALLLLSDNPDLSVSAILQPGKVVGTTDIVAKAQDKRPIHVSAGYNNFGVPFISRDRFDLGLEVGNALLPGAVFTANLIIGNDTRNLFFQLGSYSVPVGGQGTRLVLSGSNGNFDVGAFLADFKITGTLQTYDISITHPLIRSRVDNLFLDVGYLAKDNKLSLLDNVIGNDALRMLKLGVSFDRTDTTGRTFLSVYGYQGLGHILGGMADNAPDATRKGADNRFQHVNVAVGRTQSLWDRTFLILRGTGQMATGPLPVIEEFFLGGADSVRGYILGERLGDDGYAVSAELRFPVPYVSVAQFGLFIDNGAARIRSPSVGQQAYYSLTGVGPGLRVNLPWYDAALRVDLGFPIEPPKTQTGSLSGGSSPTLYLGINARL